MPKGPQDKNTSDFQKIETLAHDLQKIETLAHDLLGEIYKLQRCSPYISQYPSDIFDMLNYINKALITASTLTEDEAVSLHTKFTAYYSYHQVKSREIVDNLGVIKKKASALIVEMEGYDTMFEDDENVDDDDDDGENVDDEFVNFPTDPKSL